MKSYQEETPPSSISGDDINGSELENDIVYMEDSDEIYEEEINIDEEYDENIDLPDHSVTLFKNHEGSVFTCDIHPAGEIAVTGGEDDKAFVWRVTDGYILIEITGHKDSVTFVGFSFDGAYLATVDMAGNTKVWECILSSCDQNNWKLIFEYETDEFLWGQWHHKARVLFCGTKSGSVYMFNIPSGETKILPGHNFSVHCGKLFADGLHLAVCYEDGSIKVWDLKKSSVIHQIETSTDCPSIHDIDIHPNDKIIASASIGGKAFLANNGKVIGELSGGQDLETVSFCRDLSLDYLALGSLPGNVSVWDVSRQMVRNYCSKSDDSDASGVTKMFWIKDKLVTGCLDGSIRIYDGRSGKLALKLTGHRSEILDLCYNENKHIILTTSDDHTARIYKLENI